MKRRRSRQEFFLCLLDLLLIGMLDDALGLAGQFAEMAVVFEDFRIDLKSILIDAEDGQASQSSHARQCHIAHAGLE